MGMTSQQVANKKVEEEARANREREREANRSNVANENERSRANRAQEKIGKEANKIKKADVTVKGLTGLLKPLSGLANDVEWYNLDPQLLKDVSSFSYFTPHGSMLNYENFTWGDSDKFQQSIPGIMAMRWSPTLGGDPSLMRNAAQNIYSWVRHANSGHTNYEPQDLMMYLLAADSFYSFAATLRRLYSLLNTYKAESKYYGNAVITAAGFNPSDLRSHIADLRAYINMLHNRINSIRMPKIFSLNSRHVWMNERIFKDYPIKRSTDYMFVQQFYYKWAVDTETGTFLQPCYINATNSDPNKGEWKIASYSDIVRFGDALIDAFLSDEDCGIISGDILKAYGESGLVEVPQISEDYHIESEYNAEVLTQINGAVFVGDTDGFAPTPGAGNVFLRSFTIRQDSTGSIYQGLGTNYQSLISSSIYTSCGLNTATGNSRTTCQRKVGIVNMYKDDVTPGDTMVATRLMALYDAGETVAAEPSTDKVMYNRLTCYGTEVLNFGELYYFNTNDQFTDIIITDMFCGTKDKSAAVGNGEIAYALSLYACLDWKPSIFVGELSVPVVTGLQNFMTPLNILTDMCNYAVISKEELQRMHTVALISEFGIPLTGLSK